MSAEPLFTETIIPPTLPAAEAPLPGIYYAGKGGYAMKHGEGFIPLPNEGQVAQHLRAAGFEKVDISALLCRIRTENFVGHIGPVAGHKPGIHIAPDSGQPFLVTYGPRIIPADEGEHGFITRFFADLLGDGDQRAAFEAWIRQARRNVLAGRRRPLPAAVLVGPRNCGKTLAIEICRLCLGGRAAAAFAALSGNTNFNADILGAELLVIDDEIASRDHRARTALAQGIKKNLFAGFVRVEGKFREPVNMRPVQAVIVAVNDEAEHLQVIPAMDDSVADKISLFACQRANLDGLDDREAIAECINAELPGFLHHLETTDHPEHLQNTRTGAAAWQSPEIIEILRSISPEERLRELLGQCAVITDAIASSGEWSGTAAEAERLLLDNQTTGHAARSLLAWTAACGSYLGRLQASGRCSITSTVRRGITHWRISSLEPAAPSQGRFSP